jgi:hypothetical protein
MTLEDVLYDIYKLFVESSLLNDFYDNTLFTPITLAIVLGTLLICGLFYKNPFAFRTWFYKFKHWLLTMFVSGFLFGFLVAVITCFQKAGDEVMRNEKDPEQGTYFDQGSASFILLGVEFFIVSCILFFLFSIALRYVSIIARKTPF